MIFATFHGWHNRFLFFFFPSFSRSLSIRRNAKLENWKMANDGVTFFIADIINSFLGDKFPLMAMVLSNRFKGASRRYGQREGKCLCAGPGWKKAKLNYIIIFYLLGDAMLKITFHIHFTRILHHFTEAIIKWGGKEKKNINLEIGIMSEYFLCCCFIKRKVIGEWKYTSREQKL